MKKKDKKEWVANCGKRTFTVITILAFPKFTYHQGSHPLHPETAGAIHLRPLIEGSGLDFSSTLFSCPNSMLFSVVFLPSLPFSQNPDILYTIPEIKRRKNKAGMKEGIC